MAPRAFLSLWSLFIGFMTKWTIHIIFIFLFSLSGNVLIGQNDTTLLSEVSVVKTRASQFAVGSQIQNIDSTRLSNYQGQNLTDILRSESGIYTKYYSPGNLASTSSRGANASQTALTWNGFNINSPLNGIFDLSLFPLTAFDKVSVQPGASSALWGSGAIGGSIHLNHKPHFKDEGRAAVSFNIGSFGFHQENVTLGWSNKKTSHRLSLVSQYADNDFTYLNPFNQEEETQRNNQINTLGLLSENYIRLSKKDILSLNVWLQQTERQIPLAIYETALTQQDDDVLRLTSEWMHSFKKSQLKIRGAWFIENQDYTNFTQDTSYFNNNETFIGEAEYAIQLAPNHKVDIGFNATSNQADVQSYGSEPIWQHRQSVFAGYHWNILKPLQFSAMLRQEIVDANAVPFTYTLGMNWDIIWGISLKGQFSKVYRTPTLNDRYWNPGGNPDLNAEDGYAQELSLIWENQKDKFNWNVTISGFNRNISNWIIWQPSSGIWSPQNLLDVWSRGWEGRAFVKWTSNKFSIKLSGMGNYTVSTNEEPLRPNDATVGKQLIYTPIYSGIAGLDLQYSNFNISYTHSYTGYTYTASDHSSFLEPYQLGNLNFNYRYQRKMFGGSLFFKINNIWNESYQVVRNRPMPGINYNLGINLNLKFKNQQ